MEWVAAAGGTADDESDCLPADWEALFGESVSDPAGALVEVEPVGVRVVRQRLIDRRPPGFIQAWESELCGQALDGFGEDSSSLRGDDWLRGPVTVSSQG